ncbi:MAG: MBG domain-containing protein, partial [Cryomorphaceae bacterium]
SEVRASRGTALVNGALIDPEIFFEAISVPPLIQPSSRISRGTALVNTFRLVRGTALVNTVDSTGAIVNQTLLSDTSSITNSAEFLSPAFINDESNSETITILGESDIKILSGDSIGTVESIPINLVTGNTVGTHFSLAGGFLTNNFNVQYGVGLVTIIPDTLEISIDQESLVQTYDGTPKSIEIAVMPDTIPFSVTYNGETELPVNAGSYDVEVSASDSNYFGSQSATLVIEQAMATVSTGTFVIDEGDNLPEFTAEFEGFVNGEDESVLTSLTFDVVDYAGEAGEYEVIPIAEAANYTFESISGTLFVNATGEGTLPVQIKFICFEMLEEPLEGGFNFIATFAYRNLNSSPFLIPKGINNQLTGENFDDSNLPEVFQPGTNFFTIPFEASLVATETPLMWALTSNRPEGVELSFANVINIPCGEGAKSTSTDTENGKGISTDLAKVSLYPNPSSGKVTLSVNEHSSKIETVEIFDLIGRTYPFEVIADSDNFIQVELNGFSEGLYIVRIQMQDGSVETRSLLLKQ